MKILRAGGASPSEVLLGPIVVARLSPLAVTPEGAATLHWRSRSPGPQAKPGPAPAVGVLYDALARVIGAEKVTLTYLPAGHGGDPFETDSNIRLLPFSPA